MFFVCVLLKMAIPGIPPPHLDPKVVSHIIWADDYLATNTTWALYDLATHNAWAGTRL